MSFDEEFESWKIFKATLRKPDKGLFKQMIDEVKEYREAIETKENQLQEIGIASIIFFSLILFNFSNQILSAIMGIPLLIGIALTIVEPFGNNGLLVWDPSLVVD